MKYIVLYEDKEFYNIDDVIMYCIDSDYHADDDYFEEWVNNTYDSVTINGETYKPYDILHEMDYGNLSDLKDSFCEIMNEDDESNARWELERSEDGDEVEIQGYTVRVEEEDYEEDGDYDGDDIVESLRAKLDEKKRIDQTISEENKKNENDLMKMFQFIGG